MPVCIRTRTKRERKRVKADESKKENMWGFFFTVVIFTTFENDFQIHVL